MLAQSLVKMPHKKDMELKKVLVSMAGALMRDLMYQKIQMSQTALAGLQKQTLMIQILCLLKEQLLVDLNTKMPRQCQIKALMQQYIWVMMKSTSLYISSSQKINMMAKQEIFQMRALCMQQSLMVKQEIIKAVVSGQSQYMVKMGLIAKMALTHKLMQ